MLVGTGLSDCRDARARSRASGVDSKPAVTPRNPASQGGAPASFFRPVASFRMSESGGSAVES